MKIGAKDPKFNVVGVEYFADQGFSDHRGYIGTWVKLNEEEGLIRHVKIVRSKQDVLRGIHFDKRADKIISCIHGKVFQVIVDLRIESPSYLNHDTFLLSDEKQEALLIPKGCGNAFLTLSDLSIYGYALRYSGGYPDVEDQETVKWDDPKLNIKWPIEDPILSRRDTDASPL